MAKEYKILGQAAPAANVETSIFTVAAGKQLVVGHLSVCNRSQTEPVRIRIAVLPSAVATGNQHYIEYDVLVPPGKTKQFAKGATLSAEGIVRVQANNANASFTLFGVEG